MTQLKVQRAPNEMETIRNLDPNVLQRQASRPESSVWVTASAGTGKTKVLTDRVLRLLLPSTDGQPGTPTSRILCLTFTKAGAGEMALRLTKTLARWAVMPPEDLKIALQKLQGREPAAKDIEAARRLFAQVSDTPGGLKIMTIHSFCQSVLGRFPLEAGIAPHFTPLEESDASTLLQQSRDRVIKRAQTEAGSMLQNALARVAATVNEEQFLDLVRNIAGEREQLTRLLQANFGTDGLYKNLCSMLGLTQNEEPGDILLKGCENVAFNEPALRAACKIMAEDGTAGDKDNAVILQNFLQQNAATRAMSFGDYSGIYLTQKGELRKKLLGVGAERKVPGTEAILLAEGERLIALKERMNKAASAVLTRDLLILGDEIIREYQGLKHERAALDFDDLIFITCALLEGRADYLKGDAAASWVLYKLDNGLDHILIDEAQDTNPEQWKVVEALCREFTDGIGARDVERTVFVVGDEKQSIYSFQRASPEEFARMQKFLRGKIEAAKKEWDDVPLNISFRSSQSVLQAVDAVFNGPMQGGVSTVPVKHESFRRGQAGHVELWPVCETPDGDDFDPWTPPTEIIESTSGAALLAAKIAGTIRDWLDKGEQLPSHGRSIKPGDIMILVRTRNAFFNQIAKALKDKNIPVSGSDRMILNEQIAVQDLLAFAQFALQPHDDLTLATILKSPLIGMTEDELFAAAYNRKAPLWNVLSGKPKDYLLHVMKNGASLRPFDFLTALLHEPCPADERSGLRAMQKRLGPDILDPLDELLNAALNFEASHTPSLQQFVHWQAHEETEIKRQMEEGGGNFVRIMTVHGSKGLQAPIVILPDTMRGQRGAPAQADRRLLWPDKTELPTPLWSPRSDMAFEIYNDALTRIDSRLDEEYRRLLYVAMTRAEDRLYIAGHTGKKSPLNDSWYYAIETALKEIPGIETLEDGTLRLANPQTRDPDRQTMESAKQKSVVDLPAWIFKPAPQETAKTAPLRPSRDIEELEPPVNSPLKGDSNYRFRRGNLTHKLLEILPGLSPENRESAAQNFLRRFARDLPAEIQDAIVAETMKLLNDPEFADVFGPNSLAEIPVTGKLPDGRVISGQIDRLLVSETEILIIDYKTNRPPPLKVEDVPAIYMAQMQAYADVLRQIYPGRTISCALLWTDGARLMKLPVRPAS